MMKKFWRPEAGIFLGLWLVLMLGGRSRLLRDPGTLWHTRLGQIMLDTHQLIRDDPFSFSAGNLFPKTETWIPHQWLGECLMAFVHRAAGWDGLLLATVTLLATLYTWVANRLLRSGLHWLPVVVLTALTVAASSAHFLARSHLSTIVFFGLTGACLIDYERGRISLASLFWLVPIYVLWTNLHGGLLGGLFTMVLALAGWVVAHLLHNYRGSSVDCRLSTEQTPLPEWRHLSLLVLLILLCGMTAFINPYGTKLPRVWFKIMGLRNLSTIIEEHAPLDPSAPEGLMVLLLGAVYLFVLAGSGRRWPGVTALLPIVWFGLACSRIRHAPLFAVLAALVIADVFPRSLWAAALARRGSDLFVPPARTVDARSSIVDPGLLLPLVVVLTTAALQMTGVVFPLFGRGWATLDPVLCPSELQAPLADLEEGTPVFNELNLGGFLMYFTPHVRVFIDDRCELYGDQFLLEYDQASKTDSARIKEWARRCPFDWAATQTGSGFDTYLAGSTATWELVGEAPTAHLFHRRRSATTSSQAKLP